MPEVRPGVVVLVSPNVIGVVVDYTLGLTDIWACDRTQYHRHTHEVETLHDTDERVIPHLAFVKEIREDFDLPLPD